MKVLKKGLRIAEGLVFMAVVIANLAAIFQTRFFPTLDGVAHLYNSNLINHLLLDGSEFLHRFYIFNPQPVPNWTGHIILSIFNLWLPAHQADQVFLLLYLAGLPYAFRWLIKVAGAKNLLLSYAIFPFTYSFVFLYGFYNYCISLVFFFVAFAWWLKIRNSPKTRGLVLLGVLFFFTYFSHVFTFALLLLLIGFLVIFELCTGLVNPQLRMAGLKRAVMQTKCLLLTALVPMLLLVQYLISNDLSGGATYLGFPRLVKDLEQIGFLMAYLPELESIHTTRIFHILAALFLVALIARAIAAWRKRRNGTPNSDSTGFFSPGDYWLFAALVLLIMYFTMPDSGGGGGYVSMRLGLMFFMVMIVWLARQRIPVIISVVAMVGLLDAHFEVKEFYDDKMEQLNGVAKNCYAAAEYVEANSTVLPINFGYDWMTGHFSNYLGIEKPMVILDNYETIVGYFPLRWNDTEFPNVLLGTLQQPEVGCTHWKSNLRGSAQPADYVFIMGNVPEPGEICHQKIREALATHYLLLYENVDCKLYGYKN